MIILNSSSSFSPSSSTLSRPLWWHPLCHQPLSFRLGVSPCYLLFHSHPAGCHVSNRHPQACGFGPGVDSEQNRVTPGLLRLLELSCLPKQAETFFPITACFCHSFGFGLLSPRWWCLPPFRALLCRAVDRQGPEGLLMFLPACLPREGWGGRVAFGLSRLSLAIVFVCWAGCGSALSSCPSCLLGVTFGPFQRDRNGISKGW